MMVLIPVLLATLLGFGVASALLLRDKQTRLLERAALAYPLGLGLITIQMFLLGVAKVPLKLTTTAPLVITEVAVLCIWLFRQQAGFAGESISADLSRRTHRGKNTKVLETILTLWITIKIATVFVEASLRPIFSFDTFTNWSVRAKAFYYSGSLLLDPLAADFFGRGISHSLGNFPPLNPLAQVWMAQWLGSFDEVLVKFWSPFYLVSMVVYLYLIIAKELSRLFSLIIVVFLISSPLLALHATETMSDLPLAVYILFGLVAILNVSRGRMAYLPLIGIFSSLAMFNKAEGIIIALLLCVTCLVVLCQDSRLGKYSFRAVAIPFFLPYLLALPWLIFKFVYNLGLGPDPSTKVLYFNVIRTFEYITDFLVLQNFNLIFLFIPILLILYGRYDREILLMIVPIGTFALFFLSIYVFIAYYADYSSGYSSNVYRNALTFYPSACLIMALLLKRLTSSES